jgi:predicted permease
MKWRDAARARLRLLFARTAAESRMNREFRHHLELEAEQLVRTKGLSPGEARRQALIAFGGVEKHKEALRDGRGLGWLDRFSLDIKLAARLLVRYPMLTIVATVSMAFGIAIGVGSFEIRTQVVAPSIPLDEGSRIVGLRTWDPSRVRRVPPTAEDFATWREALTRVNELSAATIFQRNLITNDGRSEAVSVAAMTASAFRVARVQPFLGRTLIDADERPGAPAVIVIGHQIWRDRFASRPDVLGRTVRLGNETTTVVGVMPDGFVFPAAHDVWIPLRIDPAASATAQRPPLLVFGRLAEQVSTEQAEAELNTIGLRPAAGSSETREHLRPQLVPFAWLFFGPADVQTALSLGNAFMVMLLVLVSANVALLMFARGASRESEITVRSALGAGRARIVAQLFIEALVLTALAAGVGLAVTRAGLRSLRAMVEADSGQRLPFWVVDSLTPSTVIYAIVLTVLCATIIGVLPALRITDRSVQARLRESAAGGGGVRFGGLWTAVIAAQVATTLLFPAAAFVFHRGVVAGQTRDLGFPADRYLSARLDLDRESAPGVPLDATDEAFRSRVRRTYAELEQRLTAEPEVIGLTFADRLPGTLHPRYRIELDDQNSTASLPGHEVVSASVAINFFSVLGAPILSGRDFTSADLDSGVGVAIVNQPFVNQVLNSQNPIGRRLRRRPLDASSTPGPWLQIVGVVRDLGMLGTNANPAAGIYHPVSPDSASPLRLAIRSRVSPTSFAARLRTVTGEVEPTLQVLDLMPLDAAGANLWLESQYVSWLFTVMGGIAMLLSLTAIYSVMAFTVARKTREIGIRVTLGADRRRVMSVILRRPVTQVGLGVLAGAIIVAVFYAALNDGAPTVIEVALIAAYSIVMMGVCLLACVVPARRALRVEAADVLRVDV